MSRALWRLEKAQLPSLQGFDPPKFFDAFLDAVSWASLSSADDKALQALQRIDNPRVVPFDLAEPLSIRRSKFFIC